MVSRKPGSERESYEVNRTMGPEPVKKMPPFMASSFPLLENEVQGSTWVWIDRFDQAYMEEASKNGSAGRFTRFVDGKGRRRFEVVPSERKTSTGTP